MAAPSARAGNLSGAGRVDNLMASFPFTRENRQYPTAASTPVYLAPGLLD